MFCFAEAPLIELPKIARLVGAERETPTWKYQFFVFSSDSGRTMHYPQGSVLNAEVADFRPQALCCGPSFTDFSQHIVRAIQCMQEERCPSCLSLRGICSIEHQQAKWGSWCQPQLETAVTHLANHRATRHVFQAVFAAGAKQTGSLVLKAATCAPPIEPSSNHSPSRGDRQSARPMKT